MIALAGGLVLLLSTIAAILGYYRGRAAVLLLASILVINCILLPFLPTLFIRVGWWGGLLCLSIALIGIGLCQRRLQQKKHNQEQPTSTMRVYAWRFLGTISGIVLALLLCLLISLGVTWLSSATAQHAQHTQQTQQTQQTQLNAATHNVKPETDEWAGMRVFGSELASISGGLLVHVPGVGERTRYLQTMQLILLTPPEELQHIAEAHGLDIIIQRPCVQSALRDKVFAKHLKAFSDGDMRSIDDLIDSAHIDALRADPVVSATVEQFDIDAFAADLRRIQEDNAEKEQPATK